MRFVALKCAAEIAQVTLPNLLTGWMRHSIPDVIPYDTACRIAHYNCCRVPFQVIGGCCRTGPSTVRAVAAALAPRGGW